MPRKRVTECDCPCHDGGPVVHPVPCCDWPNTSQIVRRIVNRIRRKPKSQHTTNEIARFLRQLKHRLEAAGMPLAEQRRHIREDLHLESVLMAKLVHDAEEAGAPPSHGAEEARATVQHWIAEFWPDT